MRTSVEELQNKAGEYLSDFQIMMQKVNRYYKRLQEIRSAFRHSGEAWDRRFEDMARRDSVVRPRAQLSQAQRDMMRPGAARELFDEIMKMELMDGVTHESMKKLADRPSVSTPTSRS
ncbi:hypothetical protein FOZ76_10790 [Verticiella sediminum]|uniref:Uncharacterized protein n=1 Tax=Verticiella sediminum TaxID=1247510 RepID=A0A556ARJ9_9BURK|nr:hypothetical protein [Verticiella sediminum]TSH95574.1 hypothetical protein FOZ76_10790 [Verticiella sediminum]